MMRRATDSGGVSRKVLAIKARPKYQASLAGKVKSPLVTNKAQPATARRLSPSVTTGNAADEPAHDFVTIFGAVEDPRLERHRQHALMDILFISVAATLAFAEGPSDIVDFAKEKLAWCRKFVPLANGVPSHDTVGRVLALVKPAQFQRAFLDWLACWHAQANDSEQPEHIAIDGKTACGSHRDQREHPLHLVSAWASRLGLTLGQVAVAEKSNEITAIPCVLRMLELKGAIVTIDAMGCQKEIAQQIVAGGGDFVLAVKMNQPKLFAAIQDFFFVRHERKDWQELDCRRHRTVERSRGRTEDRWYAVAPLPAALQHLCRDWPGLQSIGQVTNVTTHGDKVTTETRYYISSRPPAVQDFATAVRKHWSIESMHWVLDVVFGEDASRLREGHLATNFSCLRKFALSLFRQDTSAGSIKGKRKRAAWNTAFLESVLFSQGV
jgi:predicted transposase YbfD/YdcC